MDYTDEPSLDVGTREVAVTEGSSRDLPCDVPVGTSRLAVRSPHHGRQGGGVILDPEDIAAVKAACRALPATAVQHQGAHVVELRANPKPVPEIHKFVEEAVAHPVTWDEARRAIWFAVDTTEMTLGGLYWTIFDHARS